MTHFLFLLIVPALSFFGISAVSLVAFLLFEVIRYRKVYVSDAWSEEALLEERIASGTLPQALPVFIVDQDQFGTQQSFVIKEPSGKGSHEPALAHGTAR